MEHTQEKPTDGWVLEIFNVIAKADLVRSLYRKISNDGPVYSVDNYLDVISRLTGYDINVRYIDWGSYHIRGGCLHFDNQTAIIAVAEHKDKNPKHGVTFCEQRFITMKEAAQLIIDDEESYIKDCREFIEDILIENVSITDFNKQGRSDIFYGKIFAMELLFPWEYRAKAKTDIESGIKTSLEVATEFRIPEKELLWFISDRLHPALERIHAAYDSAMKSLEAQYTHNK